ncbi:hypothetical protein A2U01_0105258, partial [Trifolium medium]|nr:hypothetical protein [Trifolium medium]
VYCNVGCDEQHAIQAMSAGSVRFRRVNFF